MSSEEHISFFSRIKNWCSVHRDFFRILLCFVLVLFFVAILAVAERTGAYKGGMENKDFDEIYPLWTSPPKGYIVDNQSQDLLKVPVFITVSGPKDILYKLKSTSFRIVGKIENGKGVLITPDNVEIINREYSPHVTVKEVRVKEVKQGIEMRENQHGVFFKIELDRVMRKKLPVNVVFLDADNDCKEIDLAEMKKKMFPDFIWVTGSKKYFDSYSQIDTEPVEAKNVTQSFTKEVQLKKDPLIYAVESSVDILFPFKGVYAEEEFSLPVSVIFPVRNGEQYTLLSELKNVKVTLRGKKEVLEKLKSEPHKYVCPYISLSEGNVSDGESEESPKVECLIKEPGIQVTKIEPKNLTNFRYERKVTSLDMEPESNSEEEKNNGNDSAGSTVSQSRTDTKI